MKLSSSQYIRDNHNYQKECIEPRLRILEESKKEKELNIWGITYNGQFTEYQEYVNTVNTIEDKSYLFEYNAILNLIK